MSSPTWLWISEADVVRMMDIRGAIDALEAGLALEAQGNAQNMVKTHVEWGEGGTLHAIGAVFPRAELAGTKTWAHTKGGATPLLILFDSNNGALKAIIEAFALGQMRTAAATGVATRWLSKPTADTFAIIGTGKQALPQVAAVLAVRPIRQIHVFSRNADRRTEFASRVQTEFGVKTLAAASISEAVTGASVITLVTRAIDPILTSEMVTRGTHINSIGAIIPSRAEVSQDVLERSNVIVTDSVPQARRLSRELIQFLGSESDPAWNNIIPLAKIVVDARNRDDACDLTLFKSLGVGISDLSLGMKLYNEAVSAGLGQKLALPKKMPPRLTSSTTAQKI